MVELKYLKCRGLEVAPPVGLVTLKAIFFSVYMESGSVAKAVAWPNGSRVGREAGGLPTLTISGIPDFEGSGG
eukprot:523000-Pyramimonas_sp.AAC.1